jgi:P27 family predicted phage terminase small subunit
VKRARGNPGRRKLAKEEVVTPAQAQRLVIAPAWLPKAALPIWTEYVAPAIAGRVLTPRDKHELANLVMAEYTLRKAVKKLEKDGLMVSGSVGQKVKNPLIQVVHAYSLLCTRLRANFGLNPSARSGIQLGDGGAVPESKDKTPAESESAREERVVQPFKPRIIDGGRK